MSATTKQEIITQLYLNKKLKSDAKSISKGKAAFTDDLFQELFLHLCEQPDEKILHMHENEYLYYYSLKFLAHQFNSDHSDFFYTYKQPKRKEVDITDFYSLPHADEEPQETIKRQLLPLTPHIRQFINTLPDYDKDMFLLYVDSKLSFRQMAKQLDIKKDTIYSTIRKVIRLIKSHIEKHNLKDKI